MADSRKQTCSERTSVTCKYCDHTHWVDCPEEVVGCFKVYDGYENRSYPMCAKHGFDQKERNSGR